MQRFDSDIKSILGVRTINIIPRLRRRTRTAAYISGNNFLSTISNPATFPARYFGDIGVLIGNVATAKFATPAAQCVIVVKSREALQIERTEPNSGRNQSRTYPWDEGRFSESMKYAPLEIPAEVSQKESDLERYKV